MKLFLLHFRVKDESLSLTLNLTFEKGSLFQVHHVVFIAKNTKIFLVHLLTIFDSGPVGVQ